MSLVMCNDDKRHNNCITMYTETVIARKKRRRRRITRYSRCFSSVCVRLSLSVSLSSARRQKAVWKELSCILLLLLHRRCCRRGSLLRLSPFFGISSANLIISIVEPAGCVCARMNRKPRMTRCYQWLKSNEVRGEKAR